ncbi:MAG: cell division protein ZapA [Proteobacteria bacterium]|nr:cell division protein ZapA [Pseudomonadota bacterium]
MPEISLNINERNYQVTCDDGQEEHLRKLAEHLDERIQGLVGAVGQVGEGRLLVMASLMVADELFEAYKENHALKAAISGAAKEGPGEGGAGEGAEGAAAAALEACAQRIETIAARLGEA